MGLVVCVCWASERGFVGAADGVASSVKNVQMVIVKIIAVYRIVETAMVSCKENCGRIVYEIVLNEAIVRR